MSRRPPVSGKALIGVAVVLVLVAVAIVAFPRDEPTRVTAQFTRAVGLYPGSDVRILGVKVGTVKSVRSHGTAVDVVLEYDGKYKVPASAKAAVVASSLVSDRYVQLLPAYTSGPALKSGATIPLDRTAVPVELDRITQSVDDLSVALGPQGANKSGSLSRLLDTSDRNLAGNGQQINTTLHDLSDAASTLSDGRQDLFGTVKNLQTFTSTLATNDTQVRRLNTDLASVADQLSAERGDLGLALKNLAVALSEVSTFVQDNRQVMTKDVGALASVTGTVAKQRAALAETLENAPLALNNLSNAYNPTSGTLDTRDNAGASNPTQLLCQLLAGPANIPLATCAKTLSTVLGPVLQLLTSPMDMLSPGGVPGAGDIPLNLLSAVPGALAAPSGGQADQGSTSTADSTTGRPGPGQPVTVDRRGPDPTLGGILGGAR